jgi:hypothetical protein
MTSIASEYPLGLEEIHKFHDQGYLGPYTLRTPDKMAVVRSRIEGDVLTKDGGQIAPTGNTPDIWIHPWYTASVPIRPLRIASSLSWDRTLYSGVPISGSSTREEGRSPGTRTQLLAARSAPKRHRLARYR